MVCVVDFIFTDVLIPFLVNIIAGLICHIILSRFEENDNDY